MLKKCANKKFAEVFNGIKTTKLWANPTHLDRRVITIKWNAIFIYVYVIPDNGEPAIAIVQWLLPSKFGCIPICWRVIHGKCESKLLNPFVKPYTFGKILHDNLHEMRQIYPCLYVKNQRSNLSVLFFHIYINGKCKSCFFFKFHFDLYFYELKKNFDLCSMKQSEKKVCGIPLSFCQQIFIQYIDFTFLFNITFLSWLCKFLFTFPYIFWQRTLV